MTNYSETPDTSAASTLMFGDKPIRIFTFEPGGVPHFALQDICEAMGWSAPTAAAKVDSIYFPEHGKRTAIEQTEEGSASVTVLTPVGVFYLTDLIDAGKGQRITAWAKREARRLHPEPRKGDPAVFLTLSPGGRRPPRPLPFSGYRSEWNDIRYYGPPSLAHDPVRELRELRMRALEEERLAFLDTQRAKGETV